MGHTNFNNEEMLWWRERALEDAQEWTDVVQYHLDRDLSVLLYQNYYDGNSGAYSILWQILRVLEQSFVCSYLGMIHFRTTPSQANISRLRL